MPVGENGNSFLPPATSPSSSRSVRPPFFGVWYWRINSYHPVSCNSSAYLYFRLLIISASPLFLPIRDGPTRSYTSIYLDPVVCIFLFCAILLAARSRSSFFAELGGSGPCMAAWLMWDPKIGKSFYRYNNCWTYTGIYSALGLWTNLLLRGATL